jgi:hypothetical protein
LSALAVAVAVVTVAACASGGGVDASAERDVATTTTSTPATSTSAPSREQQVVAAYRAHWAAWYAAAQVPDPELPAIALTTTGSLLEHTRRELEDMRTRGEKVKGDSGVAPIDVRQPRVVQFQTDTSAVLSDCYVDNTVRYDASGQPIGSTQPTFFAATATLVQVDGTWRVASLQLRKDACRA